MFWVVTLKPVMLLAVYPHSILDQFLKLLSPLVIQTHNTGKKGPRLENTKIDSFTTKILRLSSEKTRKKWNQAQLLLHTYTYMSMFAYSAYAYSIVLIICRISCNKDSFILLLVSCSRLRKECFCNNCFIMAFSH